MISIQTACDAHVLVQHSKAMPSMYILREPNLSVPQPTKMSPHTAPTC
jgi:hypothetical protein